MSVDTEQITSEIVATSIQDYKRVEDARFLTGEGKYLGDFDHPGMKHIALLRSPYAHARILDIDVSGALAVQGVVAVFTGEELAKYNNPMHHHLDMIPTLRQIQWTILPIDKVIYVGEPVVCVVADSRYIAEDALENIIVEYEELPPVVDAEKALSRKSAQIYEDWGDNIFLHMPGTHGGDTAKAFKEADGVIEERITNHRIAALPLEGMGAWAEYNSSTGDLSMASSTQSPHFLKTTISEVTDLSASKILLFAPDMGGGFGAKNHVMREEVLVAAVALRMTDPVMWQQDRNEHLSASVQHREQIHDVKLAYDNDGKIKAVSVNIIADVGSPEVYVVGAAPDVVTTGVIPNLYSIENYEFDLKCVCTNKAPKGGYRGFGQPQGIFTIERCVDMVAEKLGMDPVEVRRRNLIPDDPRPFVSITGSKIDVGSMHDQLDRLVEEMGYEDWRSYQQQARAEGKFVGVGIANIVEPTAPSLHSLAGQFGGYEMALMSVLPDCTVSVQVGTKSQGQGHETIFADLVAEVLTIPSSSVTVRDGDTTMLPFGMGTWGSRSAVMGGGAVIKAAREIRDKMATIAAGMLGVDTAVLELRDGAFHLGDAVISLAEIANVSYLHNFALPPDVDPGLVAFVCYEPAVAEPFPNPETGKFNVANTHTSAAAGAVVEVDIETGRVEIKDLTLVHDCGTVINQKILDGQIRGAIAQSVGATFLEEIRYDDNGQPLTTTLLDYIVPGFNDVFEPKIVHMETPSELIGGFRGAGEGPIIVAPAALANAVADALSPLGAKVLQTNLGPQRIKEILR